MFSGATVIGLHAHTGSGILTEADNWVWVADFLLSFQQYFPKLIKLNLGGGFGVVQNPCTEEPLDLVVISNRLLTWKNENDLHGIELCIEPGRYIVACSGVLLAKVTQIKTKDKTKKFLGINTGFNTFLRPILYSAYHYAVNISRIHESRDWNVDVVGNICESGDVLASDRFFPHSHENDIILLATVGAYGRSMASEYNMRKPAQEIFLFKQDC
eukprot:TRINITY_DN5055_c0_g1_i16.p1 TRINITY_DN5055_c0_g1~~TRINITY_DN5055_c0_g1_i16.p1  ORF type:complete len:214 (-),score=34.89 TRINITY_DN5055_c0_g1_i16:33-674(-)